MALHDPAADPSPRRTTRRAVLAGAALAAAGIATRLPADHFAQASPSSATPAASPTAIDEMAALAALAAAGIAVYEHAIDPAPLTAVAAPGPIALLGFQFRAMLSEANHGGGVLGADLDDLTLDPSLSPWASASATPSAANATSATPPIPPSLLAAAYIQAGDSPGAMLARAFLPAADVANSGATIFPKLVLTLFAAEIAREEGGQNRAWTPAGAPGVHALVLQGGACSAVQGFIDNVLNSLFSALHVNLGSSVPGKILGGIINFLLTAAQFAAKQALNALTAPVLSVIKTIAGVVGVVGIVVSAIRPWTVLLQPRPAATRFSVGAETAIPGLVDCTVDLGGFDEWPPEIADCAATVGVPLPDLKPAGAPCRWTAVTTGQPVIALDDQSAALDGAGHAALKYHTLSEDEETAKGTAVQSLVKVTANVTRPAIADFQKTLSNLVFAQLPAIVATFVRPILGPPVDSLLGRLAALTESRASAIISITFHTPKEKTPTPVPVPTKPSGQAGTIAATFTSQAPDNPFPVTFAVKAQSCDGVRWKGSMRLDAHIDGGVAKLDLNETLPCAWSFAKGKTAKANVGPFTTQVIYAQSAPAPYAVVVHMTAVKSSGKKGSLGAISFSFSVTVTVSGSTVDTPVTGSTNLDRPIPITPGASNC